MKARKHQKAKSPVFRDICAKNRCGAAERLASRARLANGLAKISTNPAHARIAYATKHAALNQGLACDMFRLRSDEQGRTHLLQVADDEGRALHLPRKSLSPRTMRRSQTKAILGMKRQNDAA